MRLYKAHWQPEAFRGPPAQPGAGGHVGRTVVIISATTARPHGSMAHQQPAAFERARGSPRDRSRAGPRGERPELGTCWPAPTIAECSAGRTGGKGGLREPSLLPRLRGRPEAVFSRTSGKATVPLRDAGFRSFTRATARRRSTTCRRTHGAVTSRSGPSSPPNTASGAVIHGLARGAERRRPGPAAEEGLGIWGLGYCAETGPRAPPARRSRDPQQDETENSRDSTGREPRRGEPS